MFKFIKIPRLLRHAFFQRSELERMLLLSVGFSIGLNIFRTVYTGYPTFSFLIWNLCFAAIPFLISRNLIRHPQWIEHRFKFWLAFICWLLFIPHSFYLLTDFFHLRERLEVPLWFDLALVFSSAWNGLQLGMLSVRQVEKIIRARFGLRHEALFLVPVMLLNGLGVFLGRYLRFNGYDVYTHPLSLISDIFSLLLHPMRNRYDWSMIVCFTLLLIFVYGSLKRINKTIW